LFFPEGGGLNKEGIYLKLTEKKIKLNLDQLMGAKKML